MADVTETWQSVGELAERVRRKWWARQWRELYDAWPPADRPADAFEQWLVRKWLAEVRSPEFAASADFERLRAEWERS